MIGVNSVNISGNVKGRIVFQKTKVKQTPACSFSIVSDRKGPNGAKYSTSIKINAYGENLTNLCDKMLTKGAYVFIQGELMNRPGIHGELTEVRANQIIFNPNPKDPLDKSSPHSAISEEVYVTDEE